MIYDEMLVRLKAPQSLEQFGQSLDEVERAMRERHDFWQRERESEPDGSCLHVLFVRMRFYVLVLNAQHIIIDELSRVSTTVVEG